MSASDQARLEATLAQATEALRRREPADAESLLLGVLAIDPKNLHARRLMVAALRAQSKLDDAVSVARALVREDPSTADSHALLCLALLERNDLTQLDDAVTAGREAVRLKPIEPRYWLRLGAALR